MPPYFLPYRLFGLYFKGVNKQMRYVKFSLLSLGAVIACSLITTLSNLETANGGISSIVLITVLIFIGRFTTDPNRNFFS